MIDYLLLHKINKLKKFFKKLRHFKDLNSGYCGRIGKQHSGRENLDEFKTNSLKGRRVILDNERIGEKY